VAELKMYSILLVNGGRDGKGMISWKGTLKQKEVSSYILSLKDSNPKIQSTGR
jgi:hypothetical protein